MSRNHEYSGDEGSEADTQVVYRVSRNGARPLVAAGIHKQHTVRKRLRQRISQLAPAGGGKRSAKILPALTGTEDPSVPASWFVGRIPRTKRAMDLALIFLCLPILVPLFAAIAAYIKLVSRGPVFFAQDRIGYRGLPFRMFKFRSMRLNSDDGTHELHTTFLYNTNMPLEKRDHLDTRLIPYAWVLRSTGMDELPQLINVLRGEMSLVGPRPLTRYEHEMLLPWHDRRCDSLPGLTGLWQVSGKNSTTFLQMISYDIAYGRRWSFLVDVKIILMTLPVLVGQFYQTMKKQRSVRSSHPAPG